MASLWLNTDIPQKVLRKSFWGKYTHRLEISTLHARLLRGTTGLQQEHLIRQQVSRNNYVGGPTGRLVHNIEPYYQLITELKAKFKYNVEYRTIRVFGNSDADMQEAINIFKRYEQHLGDMKFKAVSVPGPELLKVLASGKRAEIVARKTEYTHKVTLRDRKIGTAAKHQILNYLDGLGDTVSVSRSVRRNLASNNVWSVSVWFRTKDPSILAFLELISPGIVSKTVEVISLDK